jgi:hypothetical protein
MDLLNGVISARHPTDHESVRSQRSAIRTQGEML